LQYGVGWETLGAWMITGLMVGAAQWLILRRSVALATWWAAISALCWVLAMAGWPLGVIPAGAVSGAVMVWMLKHKYRIEKYDGTGLFMD
jgi:CHASE2 domain-containing sensor protein